MKKKDLSTDKKTNLPKDTVMRVMDRITDLKTHRSGIKANPYDVSKNARTIEKVWDYADFVALPHKFSTPEMQSWMSDNSLPLIMAKIDTALSVIIAKNPEVEISGKSEGFDKKAKVLKALYDLSWEKGCGRQQLIRYVYNFAKYGTAVGREYHKFEQQELEEVIAYHPEGKHETQKKLITLHDEPIFEVLPLRDVYIDDRAVPYNDDSINDWAWTVEFDYNEAMEIFKNYNLKGVEPTIKERKDKADFINSGKNSLALWFYENKRNNEFIITDGINLIHKGPLLDGELTLVICQWKLRNDFCIYGIGLPEELEHNQTMLDRLANMTLNQTMLAIGGSGWYGGIGNLNSADMVLEPKLKKLKDAEKIIFPKIPSPDQFSLQMIEFVLDQADEISGVTKSLGGEQVGKTLGEAVLNREAGLRRLALPLQNLEFAMERHARLRINSLQRIYGRPIKSQLLMDQLGSVVDEKLWAKYQEERGKKAGTVEFDQKYPEDASGAIYMNTFKTEKLPFEKNKEGEVEPSGAGMWLEITPEEIRGDYDITIKAMSTIPMSQTLREAQTLETFNMVSPLPYTDIYKAEVNLLKARNIDPDLWMKDEKSIMETQEAAQGAPMGEIPDAFNLDVSGKPLMSPSKLQTSAGMTTDIANQLQ